MRKNVASQHVAAQMNSRTDGSPLTSAVSVFVTGDGGTQTAGGGTATHEGNGHWDYAPTQAETNFNHIAFTFVHATGVNQTVNVYTVSYDPHDTVRLGLSGIPAALVGGRMDASVGAMAAGVITAAAHAAGAIDANAIAADAGTEIGTAVWATAARTLTAIDEDSTTLDLDATIRAAMGLGAANLDAQLGAILTAIDALPTNAELATALGTADDAVLAAIAALNDFDPATDEVLANVKKINGVTIIGDGSATPFNV